MDKKSCWSQHDQPSPLPHGNTNFRKNVIKSEKYVILYSIRIFAQANYPVMEILEILKYTLPALIVLITSYLLIKIMIKNDGDRRKKEIILQNQKTITPLRLQAYERAILLLERISADSLILRVNKQGMNAQKLQQEMLSAIRAEFEHNLSQQIYMSPQVWEVIKNAKINTVKLINTTASGVKPDSPSIEFSTRLLEKVMEMEKSPTQVAIEYIKQEFNALF